MPVCVRRLSVYVVREKKTRQRITVMLHKTLLTLLFSSAGSLHIFFLIAVERRCALLAFVENVGWRVSGLSSGL